MSRRARPAVCNDGRFHQPPDGWMGELIACVCGHGIGKHTASGCTDTGRGQCRCRLVPYTILAQAQVADDEFYSEMI